jgi:hypothetical protein
MAQCPPGSDKCGAFETGRRLVMFGPDGFREAPRDHRLVIVMGSNPAAFFGAMDQALGNFASVKMERDTAPVREKLMKALLALRDDQQKLNALRIEFAVGGVR